MPGRRREARTNLDVVARLLVVVPHETDPPARLGDWLRKAGLELDERHLGTGDALPQTLEGFDGLLVLDGALAGVPEITLEASLDG